ncbi:MAG: carbohydrate ABC transporter permease [Chloroflexi bacterium]|nr:carbohydrate ABC transporter permease [Chloroflexota bacterium]
MAIAEEVTILRQPQTESQPARLSLPYALLSYGLMLIALLVMGLPLYWMLTAAFKLNSEIYQLPVTWIPHAPTLANFTDAWNAAPFGRYYLNTIITTALGSGAEILLATTSAYAFAFLRFPKKEWVFLLLLAALMVPDQVTILTNYLTIARFGWVDTYQGIVVPGAAVAYGTFLLRQAFLSQPREVLDAARVDGAGHLRTLWSVVIPLARPALVTFALISIVAKWNNFLWPLVATNRQEMRVLPIGIYRLLDQEGTTQWGTVMAGTIFVVLPVLIVFLWAQRHIVEGIAAGAVKG